LPSRVVWDNVGKGVGQATESKGRGTCGRGAGWCGVLGLSLAPPSLLVISKQSTTSFVFDGRAVRHAGSRRTELWGDDLSSAICDVRIVVSRLLRTNVRGTGPQPWPGDRSIDPMCSFFLGRAYIGLGHSRYLRAPVPGTTKSEPQNAVIFVLAPPRDLYLFLGSRG